jgi:hypothetical protein
MDIEKNKKHLVEDRNSLDYAEVYMKNRYNHEEVKYGQSGMNIENLKNGNFSAGKITKRYAKIMTHVN